MCFNVSDYDGCSDVKVSPGRPQNGTQTSSYHPHSSQIPHNGFHPSLKHQTNRLMNPVEYQEKKYSEMENLVTTSHPGISNKSTNQFSKRSPTNQVDPINYSSEMRSLPVES